MRKHPPLEGAQVTNWVSDRNLRVIIQDYGGPGAEWEEQVRQFLPLWGLCSRCTQITTYIKRQTVLAR